MSKREFLARTMHTLGITRALETCSSKAGILVINHHRIGDPSRSRFDRGVFSATADQLDSQVSYLKRRFPIVCGEELEDLVSGSRPLKRFYVAITFDDGYRDNYTAAFQVMRSNGCGGIFFLVPEYLGSNAIPWWDAIAYMVRNSRMDAIHLDIPAPLTIRLEGNREEAIHAVLRHYKRPDNQQSEEFMAQLRTATDCAIPVTGRRFLDWTEAAEMQKAGMTIGSHTLTHHILGQLSPDEQQRELSASKSVLEQKLGCNISMLAYPVGAPTTFDATTERIAEACGYRACFSFYGGFNSKDTIRKTNILRMSIEPDALLFRNQVALMNSIGRLPY